MQAPADGAGNHLGCANRCTPETVEARSGAAGRARGSRSLFP
jgi:hypothetical protein